MALEREEFECSVCKRLLHEPLTTACGHTFCRMCLSAALKAASACPLCRSPCHLNTSTAVPSVLLQYVLRAAFAGEVARRAEEAAADAVEAVHARLGLFLLPHAPLLPGVPFTALAFEPRYVLLVDRCWENGLMFGVQAGVGSRSGVTVRIAAVQERGACRVLRGVTVNRYKLLGSAPPAAAEGEFGLYSAAVAFVADEPPDSDAGVAEAEVVRACLAEAAGALSGASGGAEEEEGAEAGAARAPPPTQQERQHGARLLAALGPRLEAHDTVAAAAAALRECLCSAAHRLLLALPDAEAAAVHASVGAPPPPAASAEAASYWLASALALTPRQRARAAATVSTLTRLCLCYGVMLTAAATEEARAGGGGGERQGAGGGEGSGSSGSDGGGAGGAAAGEAAAPPPPRPRAWQRPCTTCSPGTRWPSSPARAARAATTPTRTWQRPSPWALACATPSFA